MIFRLVRKYLRYFFGFRVKLWRRIRMFCNLTARSGSSVVQLSWVFTLFDFCRISFSSVAMVMRFSCNAVDTLRSSKLTTLHSNYAATQIWICNFNCVLNWRPPRPKMPNNLYNCSGNPDLSDSRPNLHSLKPTSWKWY